MNKLSLIFRLLAIASAIAAGAIFFVSKGKLAEQKTALDSANNSAQLAQEELSASNEKISALEKRLNNEREALADSKRKLESMRSEMYTARQEVSRSQEELNAAKIEIENVENTAKRLRADLLQSEQGLATTNKSSEISHLYDRISELEKTNQGLTKSLENARALASSAPAGTTSSDAKASAPKSTYVSPFATTGSQPLPRTSIGSKTTIESVSPENGIIVLANYPELGLTTGIELTLVEDLKALGKIQVTRITNDLVVANILPGAKSRSMRVGSTVSLVR